VREREGVQVTLHKDSSRSWVNTRIGIAEGLELALEETISKISVMMDIWTGMQKKPHMAVTGHWLQAQLVTTLFSLQYKLMLRTNLIGFMYVPDHHDSKHLAAAFVYITDHISITHKVESLLQYNFIT
jgi:hypothetical protein